MELKILDGDFSVCKIKHIKNVNFDDAYCFVAKTDDEISLVCKAESVPFDVITREDHFRGFRIQGMLDFSLVGILANISGILANANISIFAVSTFNTDYIFTKSDDFEKAQRRLNESGYTIVG